jgi:RimJ/RimL family protein N-acetyltransferase
MLQINPHQIASLKKWLIPEPPCWLVGMHILNTGNGACFADRWPDPRALLLNSGGNYSLLGNPQALNPDDLKERISGYLDAPDRFVPLLKGIFPELKVWERVALELRGKPRVPPAEGCRVRRLGADDAYHLWGLTPESAWITKTWGGPPGLAASGYAWGAFVDGQLASVAATWYLGEQYEELGVVTEAAFRGRGLSAACTGALCVDVQNRGHCPTWSTSPDNLASLRVAEKTGFSLLGAARLYAIGAPLV